MVITMKKIICMFLSIILCCTFASPVFAVSIDSADEISSMLTSHSELDFSISHVYEISSNSPYTFLCDILDNAETIYENEDLGLKNYSLSISDSLPLENAASFVEIAKIDDLFSISYYSFQGEFIITQYLPDGTINTFIQHKELNAGDLPEISVTAFWGATQDVITYQPSTQSLTPNATTKTIDFPTPSECGHRDTGKNGIVVTTQKAYIDQLQQNLNIRIVEIESNYKKVSSGFKFWAMNEVIAVVAASLAFPEAGFINFLSYAGVALTTIDGARALGEAINLPKYTDYESTDGKYGDIYDTTSFNACNA